MVELIFNVRDPQHVKKATGLFLDLRNSPAVDEHFELRNLIHEFESAYDQFVTGLREFVTNPIGRERETSEIMPVEKIVEVFPDILRDSDGQGNLPIHVAAEDKKIAATFVPALAKSGIKLLEKVKDDNEKGGLTVMNGSNRTPLGMIVRRGDLKTFMNLCNTEPPLVKKKDVIEYSLLHHASCHDRNMRMVSFLVKVNPDALYSKKYYSDYLPLHASCCDTGGFAITKFLLTQALKHDPNHLSIGGLFDKDKQNRTGLAKLISRYGAERTWKCIESEISPYKDCLILHQTIKHAPQYVDEILARFPHSCFLRDKDGRLPVHTALECGLQWSISLVSILNTNSNHLGDVDPVTGFCLCGLAAMKPSCDLRTINYLIRSHPRQLEFHDTSDKSEGKKDEKSNLESPRKRQKL